jgi:hypothetical protein
MPEPTIPITDYISTAEASERSGLSRWQIAYLFRRGVLKGRKIGNSLAIIPASLDEYLANRPKPGPRPKKS